MTCMKKTMALLMALVLTALPAGAEGLIGWLFGPAETASTAPEASATLPALTVAPAAALPDAGMEDDGMLRVYLKSMKDPEKLHLRLSGSYALEGSGGFYFDRDAQVTLTAAEGSIWLAAGGLTVNLGPALTLTRHAVSDGETNGIYIEESEKANLYCGDLSLSVTESGGLRPILTLHVEDYLMGVVAYEMSDSFPIEALKAQAVAARTYAMQRKWSALARDYDLVDTTADQVYKGWDPEYDNVIAAVNDTRGIVGIYEGGFATCYYTASNGGQTALAGQIWGGSPAADGYLAMADDPYDLENPHSLENDLTFTAKCEGSLKLRQLLTDALKGVMKDQGYDDFTLDAIAAIEPVNPRFEGSRMYEGLAFDLMVKVPESALATPTPSAAPSESPSLAPPATPPAVPDLPPEPEKWVLLDDAQRVILGVYDDIKDGLSMGLNGSDCELISVETQKNAEGEAESFRLVMRRYGHGVGMSQRGAQQMAGEHGMDFMEILKFYYPGMMVARMAWPDGELTPIEALPAQVISDRPAPTPRPTPAPLPALKDGEHYATVIASSLNVRENPTTAARVVDILDQGRRLIVSGTANEDGWVAVHTAEIEGYVKEEYLKRE